MGHGAGIDSHGQRPRIDSVSQTVSNPPGQIPALRPQGAPRVLDAPRVVRLWHLTSLDAPTVAVVWTLAFAWASGARLPAWIPILLGLAAWTAYIGDRLLDVRAAMRTGRLDWLAERHRFHHLHRGRFTAVSVCATIGAAGIVFTLMPGAARVRNGALALAALAYFTIVHLRSERGMANNDAEPDFSAKGREIHAMKARPSTQTQRNGLPGKEFLVGMIFTAACALPAGSRMGDLAGGMKVAMGATALGFALLAWLNCHLIDWWEDPESKTNTDLPVPAILLGVGMLVAAASLAPYGIRLTALLLTGAVSAGMLAALDAWRSRLTPVALRAAADLVLLTPLVLLLK
jgi:hypothetical protein